ncbi:unnamed protein product [Cuscuta campestris]|uniref:Retrotransposon gag domain-containing protein n=1 Tax=Cuscuta campestris TaxID=132261 RepID=A0A484KMH2_9ASTE|nr:unnamed protein product [Cuscuta campestris]
MDEKDYVLEKPLPHAPLANTPKAVKDVYEKHVKDDNWVSCVMLATMTSELQKQHDYMKAHAMKGNPDMNISCETKNAFLVYGGKEELSIVGYTDANFQTDRDDFKSQAGYVFCLNGGAVTWKSYKQDTTIDSSIEAEYMAAVEAAKEVWRFNLEGFLTSATTSIGKDDVDWLQLDALIQEWILSTVNDEVSDLIIYSTTSTADLWKAIHNLFHDNKAARAMQLEQRFYNTIKGASTIATYCQTLRNIANWLDDVDAPVTENQLILQTLCGLPKDLGSRRPFCNSKNPPPIFMETRSALLLLEGQRCPQTAPCDEGTALGTLGHGGHAGFRQQGRGGAPAGGGQQGGSGQHYSGQLHGGQPQGNGGRGYGYGGRGGQPNRGHG